MSSSSMPTTSGVHWSSRHVTPILEALANLFLARSFMKFSFSQSRFGSIGLSRGSCQQG